LAEIIVDTERLLDSEEACVYLRDRHGLRRAVTTLSKLACEGGGPIYRKVGRERRYSMADLDDYAVKFVGGLLKRVGEPIETPPPPTDAPAA
jgi:hypothetical protein